jgi:ion channel-forming bestrophin family protein
MFVQRRFKLKLLFYRTLKQLIITTLWATIVVVAHDLLDFRWLGLPWFVIGVIGTAVAFYIGFKNNSAYDRIWEARKIWGGIVNSSRTMGIYTQDYITNNSNENPLTDRELKDIKRRVINRHIAWLYQLKRQLRVLKSWEHQKKVNENYRSKMIDNLFPIEDQETELRKYLSEEEMKKVLTSQNPATQIIALQSNEIKHLKSKGLIDDFRHVEFGKTLGLLYSHQGKCERIKNFPLPRQYASVGHYLVLLFIAILPLGIVSSYTGPYGYHWATIPLTVLIAWVYWLMETVGDYAEHPFQNLAFDIPITSLTRTIEIDLLEMLEEENIPGAITAKKDILM